ncbi:MAG: phosphatidylglycerophosphatase A [Saprospiraceae bacterium]
MNLSRNGYKFLLRGFGTGLLPVAPGTWGSTAAILLAWPLAMFTPDFFRLELCLLVVAATWVCATGSALLRDEWGEDPSQTVLDEMAGMWLGLIGLPLGWNYWLAAFFLFRFFDIFKPLGIRRLEKIGDGWGVVLDDLLAGVYANMVIQLFLCQALFGK